MPYNSDVNPEEFLFTSEEDTVHYGIQEYNKSKLHTSTIGIIDSFDPETQTASIQIAITAIRRVDTGHEITLTEYIKPLLLGVPCQFPSGGGYTLTFPVTKGDECLVMFTERSIDNWIALGGIQKQSAKRQFDYNDAIAILGISSMPEVITDFKTDGVELRNKAGDTSIAIESTGDITLKTPTKVIVDTPTVDFTGDLSVKGKIDVKDVNLTGDLDVKGNSTQKAVTMTELDVGASNYLKHTHNDSLNKPTTPPLV